MKRRAFLVVVGALLAQRLAAAEPARKIYRLGYLSTAPRPTVAMPSPSREALFEELRKLGYIDGHNLIVEGRWADGKTELLPELAAQLVEAKVDIILATSDGATEAAQQATRTIPIVMVNNASPVASGHVASLGRPGGNVTGTTAMTADITAKRLELLKAALPDIRRIGAFYQGNIRDAPSVVQWLRDNEAAASALGLVYEAVDLGVLPDRWDEVFRAARAHGIDAVTIIETVFYFYNRDQLAEIALRHQLPTIFPFREQAQAGGLMSYGANLVDMAHRVAVFVDKIFKGAKPADLAVEQPTKLELVINLKTAKALDITIPQSLLLRADEVIQ
jgi:ABC-type uncharacterized transport system substrate-binding protein